jgi:ring-1,2-phenylacetyl-CoA epoxidase subunit PaaE
LALHFHQLTIKDIRRETPDCVSIAFAVPQELQEEFRFVQGQTLTLRTFIDNEECRRSYSICSSPLDGELRVAVKRVEGGLFSTFANHQLKMGDVLDVMPPSGKFYTPLDRANEKHYLAFAAGSGITPILSILKTTLATEPKSSFTLIYGNRTTSSIIFKEALEALKDKYVQRLRLIHILSRERMEAEVNYGRIDEQKCMQLAKLVNYSKMDEIFLCGPEAMIFCVKDYLEKTGVPSRRIHFELFTTPVRQTTGERIFKAEKTAAKGSDETSKVTVNLDGRSFDFDLDFNSNNILDAALAQGADLPFACKGGVCCTCKAKLKEGEVLMEVNYGLEPDEVEAGFILTCQAHPRTKKVVVDFDEK